MSTTPLTDAARGFHDMDTAVSAEDMAKLETELAAAKKRIADCEFVMAHRYEIIERQEPRCNEANARAEKAEAELAASKAEIENLIWNLAGCSTIAQSGKPTDYSHELARPALHDVNRLAARAKKAEAELADHITALEIANRSADEQMRYKREAEKLWKEFITLLEITEESDSGYAFNPNKISSCRAIDGKRLNEILVEARRIVF